jgi:hypothetical protein
MFEGMTYNIERHIPKKFRQSITDRHHWQA